MGMDSSQAGRRLGCERQCGDGAAHCGPPAWATVGMDLTREELQKVLEEQRTELLDSLAYGGLVLGLVVLMAYLIRKGFTRMSRWAQSTQRWSKGCSEEEDPETLQARVAAMEEWLTALEQKILSKQTPENTVPDPLAHAD